jgi:proline iminopeptidase
VPEIDIYFSGVQPSGAFGDLNRMLRTAFAALALILVLPVAFAAEGSSCAEQQRLAHGGEFATAGDGSKIWYKIAGRDGAPTLVFLHGGPGYNAFTFEKSIGPLLEQHFRVLYLDQRGCGRSTFEGPPERYGMRLTVEDIEQLRVRTGAERWIVAGHSFGGAVAAEYATRYPERTAALLMLDTATDLARALEYQVEYIDSIADTAFAADAHRIREIARSPEPAVTRLADLYALIGRLPLQAKLLYADAANQDRMEALDRESGLMNCTNPTAVGALISEGYLSVAMPNVARRMPAPTLLIAGSKSQVIGERNILASADTWGARVVWLDAGHFVYLERPQEFLATVQAFLRNIGIE